MNIGPIATLVKRLGAACLTFVILWHVTEHAGPTRGRAIVHVNQPNVMVIVDQQSYHVGLLTPLPMVCDLKPGPHVAQVWRSGKLVGEESFNIEPGREVVVFPCEVPASVGGEGRRPQPARDVNPASLAVHSRRPEPDHARN
jgi:hypothetical protein